MAFAIKKIHCQRVENKLSVGESKIDSSMCHLIKTPDYFFIFKFIKYVNNFDRYSYKQPSANKNLSYKYFLRKICIFE